MPSRSCCRIDPRPARAPPSRVGHLLGERRRLLPGHRDDRRSTDRPVRRSARARPRRAAARDRRRPRRRSRRRWGFRRRPGRSRGTGPPVSTSDGAGAGAPGVDGEKHGCYIGSIGLRRLLRRGRYSIVREIFSHTVPRRYSFSPRSGPPSPASTRPPSPTGSAPCCRTCRRRWPGSPTTCSANPQAPLTLSIGDLAERAGTSAATVTRFCRMIGYSGYVELRVGIATDVGRSTVDRWDSWTDRDRSRLRPRRLARGPAPDADQQPHPHRCGRRPRPSTWR